MDNVEEIPISKIKVSDNTRTEMKQEEIAEMMNSLKHTGLLHPIGVYKDGGTYILMYGHQRLTAADKLGWKTITATVRQDTPPLDELITVNLVENIQRSNPSPYENMIKIKQLMQLNYSVEEVASALGVAKSYVKNLLDIDSDVDIPIDIKRDLSFHAKKKDGQRTGHLSPTLVYVISRNRNLKKEDKGRVLRYAKEHSLTVRDIELIAYLLRYSGCSFDEVVRIRGDYLYAEAHLVFSKRIFESYSIKSPTKLVRSILKKNTKLKDGLII